MSCNGVNRTQSGPYGYNDNGMGRNNVPSNVSRGMQGNPFGRYIPITTNSLNSTQQLSFDQAFVPNQQVIEPIDYRNTGNTLHNNIGDSVMNESVVEYKINIDSIDRDIRTYLDPFNYVVKFNLPSSASITPSGPLINKEFRNVKYIKLDSIVLPQYSNNIYCPKEDKYIFSPESYLPDDRFVVLQINELLDDNKIYSTSDSGVRIDPITSNSIVPPKPFGIIYPDTKLGKYYYTGTPYNSNTIYKSSKLANINRMSVRFYDSFGKPLHYDNLYTYDQLQEAYKSGNPIPITDVRHPLNKNIQNHMTFIVGVVEGHINNNTKFER